MQKNERRSPLTFSLLAIHVALFLVQAIPQFPLLRGIKLSNCYMLPLCWPGRAPVTDAWPPAFSGESGLTDYEPKREGRALSSGSPAIPPPSRAVVSQPGG